MQKFGQSNSSMSKLREAGKSMMTFQDEENNVLNQSVELPHNQALDKQQIQMAASTQLLPKLKGNQ